MGLFLPYSLSWILELSFIVLLAVYLRFKYKYLYWKRQNVKYEEPSFPMGNLKGFPMSKSIGQILADIYMRQKQFKYLGLLFFDKPALLVNDLNLIKNVLVQDFKYFQNRGGDEVISFELDPLTENLFSLRGKQWRNLRVKLTSAFTSLKIKKTLPIMQEVGITLQKQLEKTSQSEASVKDIFTRYMMDVISSCAFGVESHCMENPKAEFYTVGKQVLTPTLRQYVIGFLYGFFPSVARFLKLRLISKKTSDFFINLVEQTIALRESEKKERNDFLQLLIEIKNKGYVSDADAEKNKSAVEDADLQSFSVNQIAAQVFVFFFAAFETVSSTVQFLLYELALCDELQEKTRKEVISVIKKYNDEITYEGLQEMEFLDRIILEGLRKYPAAQILFRECASDYKLDNFTLKENVAVVIPVYGIHHDPEIYENPEKFDPDRFLPEEKDKRHHFAFLPFGEGPRNCIGNRLALLQIKMTMAMVLSAFSVKTTENTPIPLEFDPLYDAPTPKKKIVLKFIKNDNLTD